MNSEADNEKRQNYSKSTGEKEEEKQLVLVLQKLIRIWGHTQKIKPKEQQKQQGNEKPKQTENKAQISKDANAQPTTKEQTKTLSAIIYDLSQQLTSSTALGSGPSETLAEAKRYLEENFNNHSTKYKPDIFNILFLLGALPNIVYRTLVQKPQHHKHNVQQNQQDNPYLTNLMQTPLKQRLQQQYKTNTTGDYSIADIIFSAFLPPYSPNSNDPDFPQTPQTDKILRVLYTLYDLEDAQKKQLPTGEESDWEIIKEIHSILEQIQKELYQQNDEENKGTASTLFNEVDQTKLQKITDYLKYHIDQHNISTQHKTNQTTKTVSATQGLSKTTKQGVTQTTTTPNTQGNEKRQNEPVQATITKTIEAQANPQSTTTKWQTTQDNQVKTQKQHPTNTPQTKRTWKDKSLNTKIEAQAKKTQTPNNSTTTQNKQSKATQQNLTTKQQATLSHLESLLDTLENRIKAENKRQDKQQKLHTTQQEINQSKYNIQKVFIQLILNEIQKLQPSSNQEEYNPLFANASNELQEAINKTLELETQLKQAKAEQ